MKLSMFELLLRFFFGGKGSVDLCSHLLVETNTIQTVSSKINKLLILQQGPLRVNIFNKKKYK